MELQGRGRTNVTQRLLSFADPDSLPDCPVVGRGECDCAACRFAWPEEYDQPEEPAKPVAKERKATKGLREWTVEEIEGMEAEQPEGTKC